MLRELPSNRPFILRLQPEPHPERVWEQGASSERIVGARLGRIVGIELLHDRQIPGTRANIDHIAIGPGGVYVIGTKFAGGARHRDSNRFPGSDPRLLLIGGQDQTKLVTKIGNQVGAITRVLRETPIPVTPALCVVGARWPVPAQSFVRRSVWVGWPEALAELVRRPGLLDAEAMRTTARLLDARLPRS
jgi:hypothetical protein